MARWTRAVRKLGKLGTLWFPDHTSCVCELHFTYHEIVETHVGGLALVKDACPRLPRHPDLPSNNHLRGSLQANPGPRGHSRAGAPCQRSRSSSNPRATEPGPRRPSHARATLSNPLSPPKAGTRNPLGATASLAKRARPLAAPVVSIVYATGRTFTLCE